MKTNLTSFALLMFTLCACSSGATLVRKDLAGGRVALAGAYMPAMADARLLMVDHCAGRFAATELGRDVEFRCAPSADRQLARAERGGNQ
jgi:hypothetical protein